MSDEVRRIAAIQRLVRGLRGDAQRDAITMLLGNAVSDDGGQTWRAPTDAELRHIAQRARKKTRP